ncbi:restriction endonuclease subunit S [Gracilibacillus alcaliphilus]|uniref:restriction endonuclease subunit S n=1 Tax=Gracilibacillus alcaliphilus TaxID=1401441 RepID=UPI0019599181|nr:restriction endonuclease subunit S [Gracilibacillus alcaliphilus]MBM7676569.1 type I restriction enzyme S subunit [Gracilibacillus alcaliphilus]
MSKTKKSIIERALVPLKDQPYKVPGNWIWVWLGTGYSYILDNLRKPISTREREKRIGNIPYYGATGQIGWIDDYLTNEELVLVGEDGAPFLNPIKDKAYIIRGKAWVNNHAHILKSYYGSVGNKLLLHYLNQFNYYSFVSGSTRLKLTQKKLKIIPIPLMNELEQKRIADKIDRLFAKLDKIIKITEEIHEIYEKRRMAILDKAVKGTLINQNFQEESAIELLKKVIGKKKIKRQKPLAPIELDEMPYDIPENWEWVRLGEVMELISGRDIPTTECNNEGQGVPYIMGASNIRGNDIIIERWIKQPSVIGKKDDILLSVKGTVGKIVIQELEEAHLSRQIMALRAIKNGVHNEYLSFFMQTYVQILKSRSKGVIPGISRDDVLQAPFPLPPYEEQIRIVDKTKRLLFKIDSEEKNVEAILKLLPALKKSILNKAFRGELGTNAPSEESALHLLEETLQQKIK